MPDRQSVIDLAAPPTLPDIRPQLETLRQTVGLVTSIVAVPLVLAEGGVMVVGAAGGTVVVQSHTVLDCEDARLDQCRLVGWGSANGANCSIQLVDLTGSTVVLSTVALVNGAPTWIQGAWTPIDTIGGGSRKLALRCVGNGILVQSLYHVTLQCRTLRFFLR